MTTPSHSELPLLYSYRRCPYAMRARMALRVASIDCKIVDIDLRDKPLHFLRVSPKGTVPVLCLSEHVVIEESTEIMQWALSQGDPHGWLRETKDAQAQQLLAQTEGIFKRALDQYKYSSRFPGSDPLGSRQQALEALILPLARTLSTQPFIGGASPAWQDIAIFPFVRQFAGVEPVWFRTAIDTRVQQWLAHWVNSDLFLAIMQKGLRSTCA